MRALLVLLAGIAVAGLAGVAQADSPPPPHVNWTIDVDVLYAGQVPDGVHVYVQAYYDVCDLERWADPDPNPLPLCAFDRHLDTSVALL